MQNMSKTNSARAYPQSDAQQPVSIAVNELETQINLRMATLNVSTIKGKESKIADVMNEYKINIMCVQETRLKGEDVKEIGKGFTLFYTGTESKYGVGIILGEELTKQMKNVERVSDRLMMVKIMVDTEVVNIVSAYAPQRNLKKSQKEKFFEQLGDLLIRSEKCFIGADLNGHVGEKTDGFEGVHGGFGFGKRNEAGKKILEFAKDFDLSIVNTYFNKDKEHIISYKSSGHETQIDYILTRKEDNQEVEDCQAIPVKSVAKQHRMIIADIKRPIKKTEIPAAMKRIRTWELKGRRHSFNEEVSKEMKKSEDPSWERFRDVVTKALENVCGESQEPRETWWWIEKLKKAAEDEKERFKDWQKDIANAEKKQRYEESNEVGKDIVAEVEEKAEIYVSVIRDSAGKELVENVEIQNRFKEYYGNPPHMESLSDPLPAADPVDCPEPQVTIDDVKTAIKNTKPGQAGGPSQITADVIKMMDRNDEWLWQVITKIWNEKKIPNDLKKSIIVPTYKQKGDMQECKNYRGLKLLEPVLKIIESILEKRLREYIKIDQIQFGWMPGRGTLDAIFIMRQVQEKALEWNRKQYLAFFDLEDTFDSAPRELIYWSLRKKKVPEECISMVKAIYEGATTVVKCNGGLSESFEMKVGLHRGSELSPLLFATILDALIEETEGDLPCEMLYADDLVIYADDEKSLQENVWKLQRCMERGGLLVNTAKAEVMVSSKERENINVVDRQNNQLKQTGTLKCFGSTLTETGSCQAEVEIRVEAAENKWRELTPVICDKQMSLTLRAKVYKSMVRPVLLYGAGTWATKRSDLQLLKKTEMKMLEDMGKWDNSSEGEASSEKIRVELGVAEIENKVKEARLEMFGHVKRSDGCIKAAYEMKMKGKRGRGRPEQRWIDCVSKDLQEEELKESDAMDCERWTEMIQLPKFM